MFHVKQMNAILEVLSLRPCITLLLKELITVTNNDEITLFYNLRPFLTVRLQKDKDGVSVR